MSLLRALGVVFLAAAGAATAVAQTAARAPAPRPFRPVTDAMLRNPDAGDWLMWRRTWNSWGYSPLDQIDKRNVGKLKQVWAHELGKGTQEGTPIVHDGVMYVPNPGDYIQAFDAKTGAALWEYKRQYPEGVNGGTNRNMAIWGTTLIDAGADNIGVVWGISAETGKTVFKHEQRVGVMSLVTTGGGLIFGGDVGGNFRALDDKTGEVLWETNIGSPVSGYPISFAVDGKQYVAVTTGPSLVAMAARRMTPELSADSGAGQVVVFALP